MNKPTLVIMAAGMGSRFGGCKQITPVDDAGHVIIDYSIYDAVRAGFGKIVCIIKPEMEEDFRAAVGDRIMPHVDLQFAYQSGRGTDAINEHPVCPGQQFHRTAEICPIHPLQGVQQRFPMGGKDLLKNRIRGILRRNAGHVAGGLVPGQFHRQPHFKIRIAPNANASAKPHHRGGRRPCLPGQRRRGHFGGGLLPSAASAAGGRR